MYLRICERSLAVNSLSVTFQMIEKSKADIKYVRWVILSIHSTIQEFMVLWTQTQNEALIYEKSSADAYKNSLNKGTVLPSKLMIKKFRVLYEQTKKILKENYGVEIEDKLNSSVAALNRLRDEFTHYKPQGWSIWVYDLISIFMDCFDFIELLGWNKADVFQGGLELSNHAKMHLVNIREALHDLANALESKKLNP